jgi:predicted O-methyltransferase YrrM
MIRLTFILLLLFSFIFFPSLADLREEQPSTEQVQGYLHNYDFTVDWFTKNIPVWNEVLHSFKGKPDIHYLEIGVHEGMSALWMLENILTHPSSTLTGIDKFAGVTKERYSSNLNMSGFAHKVTTINGFSQVELKKLPSNSFDIIYVDGCHTSDCVLADAVLSFDLLKIGGLLIFDDYLWYAKKFPEELISQVAVDSFITSYKSSVEIVHHDYQVIIRKVENPCASLKMPYAFGCSSIGQYVYFWFPNSQGKLYPQDMSEQIKLSDRERSLLERLIKSRKFGKTKLFLDSKMSKDKDFISLTERLKLDFTNIEKEPKKGFFEALGQRFFQASPD